MDQKRPISSNVKVTARRKTLFKPLLQAPIVAFIFMLNAVFISASSGLDMDYEANKRLMVVTPDFYLITWMHADKYPVDFSNTAGWLNCTSLTCPPEATGAGAAKYKIFPDSGNNFVIAYYNSSGTLLGTGTSHPDLEEDDSDGDGVPDGYDDYPYDAANTTQVAGAIPGQFSVTPSGAASYSIPMQVPPGTAGMQPKLSFDYTSQGSNGLMGLGWSLGGLSAIQRCPKTYAQDNVLKGVDFIDDRYCLNGQRLMLANGSFYGGAGEYRTEIDQFNKIEAVVGSQGLYFTVKTQAGETFIYQQKIQSQAGSVTLTSGFALSRVEDSLGNYYTIIYGTDIAKGEYYPLEIRYTGNDARGLSPYNMIYFTYDDRQDVVTHYIKGAAFTTSKRLKKVTTPAGEYIFNYYPQNATEQSRLRSIIQCDNADNCLNTRFSWINQGSGGWESSPGFASPYAFVNDNDGVDRGTTFADLNGDGLVDLIRAREADSFDVRENTGAGWSASQWAVYMPPIIPGTSIRAPISDRDYGEDRGTRLVDINGDGLVDWVYSREGSGNFTWLNNGNGWTPASAYNLPGGVAFVDQSNGRDRGARLADLNGDGLVDLVKARENNAYQAWRNTGSGWELWSAYTPPKPIIDDDVGKDRGSRLVDLNGDGLVDWIYGHEGSTLSAWLNNGNGWTFTPNYAPPYAFVANVNGEDRGLRLVDLNGDGLVDLVKARENQTYQAWKNNGSGWVAWPEYAPLLPVAKNDNGADRGSRLIDLNGDGRTDWLYRRGTGNYAYLNNGSGWQYDANYLSPAVITSDDSKDHGVRFEDLNGDGLVDMLFAREGEGATPQAWLNKGNKVLMNVIKTGLDLETRITYNSLASMQAGYLQGPNLVNSYPNPQIQPAGFYVVTQSQISNGIGGYFTKDYQYEGLRQNLRGRGLLGFSKFTEIDYAANVKTVATYLQNFPYTGFASQVIQSMLGNNLVISTMSSSEANMPTSSAGTKFVYASSVVETRNHMNDNYLVPGTTVVTTNKTFDANGSNYPTDYGFPNTVKVVTNDGTKIFETLTTNDYAPVDTGKWHLGRLLSSITVSKINNQTDNLSTKESAFEYDPVNGLLVKEIIEPGSSEPEKLVTHYKHDGFGNIVKKTVCATDFANCGVTGQTGPSALPFRIVTTAYDAQGRFPQTITNALLQSEEHVYEPLFGKRISLTGPNLLTTEWSYDGFGREILEERADGTTTTTSYVQCKNCVGASRYKVVVEKTSAPAVVTYRDTLDRELLVVTDGFDGTDIYKETTYYGTNGLVHKVSEPYFAGASTVYWTTSTYDALNRLKTIDPADGTPDITLSYNGFTESRVRTVNSVQRTQSETKDGLGQVTQAVDEGGITVTYTYDSQGNRTKTRINGNSATDIDITYDIRGRKISMTDPDMGQWTYGYNGYGDLIQQTDAKSQTITMKYDALGRLTERTEAEGITTWTYGTAFDLNHRKIGKLTQVKGPGTDFYTRDIEYDDLGRPQSETIKLTIAPYLSNKTYTTATDYYGPTETGHGNVKTITYPVVNGPAFQVQNVYNSRGYLDKVQSPSGSTVYWDAASLDERGQLELATLGNGVTVSNAYRPESGWLDGILVEDGQDNVLYNMSYEFDSIGNLQKRIDRRPDPDVEETFTYDNLSRMLTSQVTGQSQKIYTYDALGNITSKTGVGTYSYTGCGGRPHAVCQAGSATYTYDGNGNMLTGGGRTVSYTTYNKPYQFSQGGTSVTFHYDAERNRVFKVSGGTTTAYVGMTATGNPLYEHEATGSVHQHRHFIYAGGQALAVYTRQDNAGTFTSKTEYLHRDHLGTVEAVTDGSGNVVSYFSYDTWGLQRNPNWTDASGSLPTAPGRLGFTGHESISEIGLIHMNGRVYDPLLARFLSADPNVQFSKESQSYNRYTYVSNNPLKYTDPSGYFLTLVVSLIMSTMEGLSALEIMSTMYVAGYVESGGNARYAFLTAVSAGVSKGIGDQFLKFADAGRLPLDKLIQKSILHGITQGAISAAGGGEFKSGFIGAFVSGMSENLNISENPFIGTMQTAILGGTASHLSGGKFASGAKSAAFVHLFNKCQHGFDKEQVERVRFLDSEGISASDLYDTVQYFEPMSYDGLRELVPSWSHMDNAELGIYKLSILGKMSADGNVLGQCGVVEYAAKKGAEFYIGKIFKIFRNDSITLKQKLANPQFEKPRGNVLRDKNDVIRYYSSIELKSR